MFSLTILYVTDILVIIIIIMIRYEENIFFAAEEAELDLCEEWRDWKNDAKSPKDLFPLRDFNKKPNCLFSRNVHLSFILSRPFFAEVPNTLKVKRRTWFKSLKLSILSFYKVHRSDDWIVLQDSVHSNFVFDLDKIWLKTNVHHHCALRTVVISKCSQSQRAWSKAPCPFL